MDSELLLPTEDPRRIGRDRRRFLLFTGFDLGLIFILWLIFTVSKSPGDWRAAFYNQCNLADPNLFFKSFFDIMLLSLVRLIWLIVWYGILVLNHWWPAALSTALSTGFLIPKVIFFFLDNSNNKLSQPTSDPLAYAIPICSFVISWVELYLLDIKVLTRERRTREEVIEPSDVRNVERQSRSRFGAGYASDYRTAIEESSDSDNEGGSSRRHRKRTTSNNEHEYRAYANAEYMRVGKDSMEAGRNLLGQIESWTKKHSAPLVRTTMTKEYGRIFYVKSEFSVSVEALFKILYRESENVPKWNKLVLETKTVLRINDNTDVVYSISAPALRNYVASRDFLDVRYFEQHGRIYYISSISVRSDLRTPQADSKLVRGENGPNLCVLKPSQINENRSTLEWIMNTNLKGNLPRKIVENSLTTFLLDFVKLLEAHLKNLT